MTICYYDGMLCLTLSPVIATLLGAFIGLTLWGKCVGEQGRVSLTRTSLYIGFYLCLFIVTLWMLRVKRSKYSPAVAGIILMFFLEIIQTGKYELGQRSTFVEIH